MRYILILFLLCSTAHAQSWTGTYRASGNFLGASAEMGEFGYKSSPCYKMLTPFKMEFSIRQGHEELIFNQKQLAGEQLLSYEGDDEELTVEVLLMNKPEYQIIQTMKISRRAGKIYIYGYLSKKRQDRTIICTNTFKMEGISR